MIISLELIKYKTVIAEYFYIEVISFQFTYYIISSHKYARFAELQTKLNDYVNNIDFLVKNEKMFLQI